MASTVEEIAFQLERQLAEATAKVGSAADDAWGERIEPPCAACSLLTFCRPPPLHVRPQIDEFIQQQSQQLQKAVNDHELTIRDLEGEKAARAGGGARCPDDSLCRRACARASHRGHPTCCPSLACACAAKITRLGGDEAAALHRKDNAHEGACAARSGSRKG